MKSRQINIDFPLLGLDRKSAYRRQNPYSTLDGKQAPYSTADCLNVRATETITGRERGGSRPGLMQSHLDDLGSSVRLLKNMTLSLGDGFTNYSDTFNGLTLAGAWTQASWAAELPGILSSIPAASIDTSVSEGEATLDSLLIDTAQAYTVEMLIVPWDGEFHGSYRLYLRMDDTLPDISADGVMVELTMTGADGAYSCAIRSVLASVATDYTSITGTINSARAGWLSVSVAPTTNTLTIYWNDVVLGTQVVDAQTGKKVGFGLKCTVSGGLCLVNVFRVQYYVTTTVNDLRSMLVASASGDLFRESTYGRMTQVSTNLTLRDDKSIMSDQDGQELFIADYGTVASHGTDGSVAGTALDATGVADWTTLGILPYDMVAVITNPTGTAVAGTYKISTVAAGSVTLSSAAGTGNCSYRIERAPKVYNPSTATLSIWTATLSGLISGQTTPGQVPTGCPVVCRYMDRMVLAGADTAPHVWYMARQGDPLDWDYSQADVQAAVAGTASPAGVPGEPITALVPHSDDYLVIGCRNSLWRMMGDPVSGGTLGALSHVIGIIGPKAWCIGPDGSLIFLSLDGLYSLDPGGTAFPAQISRPTLPTELVNLNPDMTTVSLEYDVKGGGVHVFVTPVSSNSAVHYWMDWGRKSFWPVALDADHEPTATCAVQATAIEESGVILGGRDGKLRRYNDLSEDDCGTSFTSYVKIGPIGLNRDGMEGSVLSMDAVVAEGSGDVNWELAGSGTFEGALAATKTSSGVWIAGLNPSEYPACRGQAFALSLTGEDNRRWAMEQVSVIMKEGGKRRIP